MPDGGSGSSVAQRSFGSSCWLLFLLASVHLTAALAHFLISVLSKSVAGDIHYGQQTCLPTKDEGVGDGGGGHRDMCATVANDSQLCGSLIGENGSLACEWKYTGLGMDYQLLVGPSFMAVYTSASIIWGIAADRFDRVTLISSSTVVFSFAMIGTAFFATKFWHLVLLRMILAAGVAGIGPIAPGIIFDSFTEKHRALAMSFFHWGIYLGGGLSNGVGKTVTDLNLFSQGWRGAFLVSGIPGIILGILMFVTAQDPPKTKSKSEYMIHNQSRKLVLSIQGNEPPTDVEEDEVIIDYEAAEAQLLIDTEKEAKMEIFSAWKYCLEPTVIILGLGACIRQAAGYTWGYNSALYFQTYYPDFNASWWLTWITIFGGCFGVVVGGFVSDRLVAPLGLSARALVLTISQLFAAPFALGTLWLGPPAAFLSLFIGYLFAEMWYGVLFAILVELLPSSIRSVGMAVALFVINNVGGNLPVLVTPLSSLIGYRGALTLLYPASLLTSSLLFSIAFVALLKK